MLWCYHSNEPPRQDFCEILFNSWGFTKRNLNFLFELLVTRKSERVNVIPSYKPRLQASTIWPWMVWISGQILSTYFFTSWTEHVHTTQKIHQIKAQLQTQFCLAILKLNIDLSTMGEKKILTYIRVFTISQKIIHRGWGGGGDFPDIPTNTEGAALPRLYSSFLLNTANRTFLMRYGI